MSLDLEVYIKLFSQGVDAARWLLAVNMIQSERTGRELKMQKIRGAGEV